MAAAAARVRVHFAGLGGAQLRHTAAKRTQQALLLSVPYMQACVQAAACWCSTVMLTCFHCCARPCAWTCTGVAAHLHHPACTHTTLGLVLQGVKPPCSSMDRRVKEPEQQSHTHGEVQTQARQPPGIAQSACSSQARWAADAACCCHETALPSLQPSAPANRRRAGRPAGRSSTVYVRALPGC